VVRVLRPEDAAVVVAVVVAGRRRRHGRGRAGIVVANVLGQHGGRRFPLVDLGQGDDGRRGEVVVGHDARVLGAHEEGEREIERLALKIRIKE